MSRIWLDDVAEAISSTRYPNDYVTAIGLKNNLLRQLRDAALSGELACYNSVGKYKPRAYETLISTTKEAVNLWLNSIDSPYRHGQTEAVGDAETGSHAGTESNGRRNNQIDLICKIAKQLGYVDLMAIPEGGKAAIKIECLKITNLFTPEGFKNAWQEANKRKLISMQDKEKYL